MHTLTGNDAATLTPSVRQHGTIGPLAPCVLCGRPALNRSPVTGVPCHKGCAETWITAHAQSASDRARLIRACTPGRGEPR